MNLLEQHTNIKLKTPENLVRSSLLNAWNKTPTSVISYTTTTDSTESLMSAESSVKKPINCKSNLLFGSARALQFSTDEYMSTIVGNNNISNSVMVESSSTQPFSSTMIESAKMLASIADFSQLFNNATAKSLNKTINISSTSPSIKVEAGNVNDNDTFNLNIDLTNNLNRSLTNGLSCQISPNIDDFNQNFSQTLALPTSFLSTLQKSTASTVSSNERSNTNERLRSTKTRKECPHCNFTTYMSQHMKSHLVKINFIKLKSS